MDALSRARAAIAVYATFGPDHASLDMAAESLGISDGRLRWLLFLATRGLPARERCVFVARMGLGGEPPVTLSQASVRLGVTRERVRQIECRALAHMRPDVRVLAPGNVLLFEPN